jgi:hypothetical protein
MTTTTKPRIDASQVNGNTLAVLAACTKALESAGMRAEAKELRSKALTGDRDFALFTMAQYVEFGWGAEKPTPSVDFEDEDATLPSGQYVVADPCYVFNDATYDALLGTEAFDDAQTHVYGFNADGKPLHVVILKTAHGDGQYHSSDGHTQLVDSGTIACIEVSNAHFKAGWEQYPQYTAKTAFQCKGTEDGELVFGTLTTIPTDDEKCEDCGGYCDNCKCEDCGECTNGTCECGYGDDDEDGDDE